MNTKTENPIIDFYGKHNITTDHHQKDYRDHLLSREKLYRLLGVPPVTFRNKKILEVGPGRGYNALVFFEWGANMDFVEPNPKAQDGIPKLLGEHGVDKDRWNLSCKKIEEYETKEKYEVIIAEGFLPGIYNRKGIIDKLKQLIEKGGVIVVTCMDELSFFLELIKRLIALQLIAKENITDFDQKVKVLSRAFASHLKSLKYASRRVEDMVLDNFLSPAIYAELFNVFDCLNDFGEEFILLGSSPSMFTDLSWYKDIGFDSRNFSLEQFQAKRHLLLWTELEDSVRPKEENNKLADKVAQLRALTEEFENDSNKNNLDKVVELLREIGLQVKDIDARLAEIVEEGIELLLDEELNEEKISEANKLKGAFGRAVQYVSLMKKHTI